MHYRAFLSVLLPTAERLYEKIQNHKVGNGTDKKITIFMQSQELVADCYVLCLLRVLHSCLLSQFYELELDHAISQYELFSHHIVQQTQS